MNDAWRAYLEVALGLTDASRKKAAKIVKKLAAQGGVTADQARTLAEDLFSAGSANREALSKLVRYELDRALGLVGLATAEEVADLTTRVRDLETKLRESRGSAPAGETPAATKAPAKKAPAKKTAAKTATTKTAAKKTVKKAAGAQWAGPGVAPAATGTGAGKATGTGATTARKTTTRRTPAKKATKATEASSPSAAPSTDGSAS